MPTITGEKTTDVFGFLAKLEASYDAGATLDEATDGVRLKTPALLSPEYAVRPSRPAAPGSKGQLLHRTPTGKNGSITPVVELRGAGVAYSASDLPEGDALFQACGLDSTLVTTGGSESVTYAPGDGASAALKMWGRGELREIQGVLGSLSFSANIGDVCDLSFALMGRMPTDEAEAASVPTITYGTAEPPILDASNMAFSIGTGTPFTGARIRSISFEQNRPVNVRSVYGHGVGGARAPRLVVVMEAVDLGAGEYTATTLNPHLLWKNVTAVPVSFTIGSTQYNRMTFSAPAAQLAELGEDEDNGTSLWTLNLDLASDPATADDFSLVFD